MNLASRGVDPMGSEMLFVNFNQDFTCLSVGSRHGYKIYNCEPFGKYFMKRIPSSSYVSSCQRMARLRSARCCFRQVWLLWLVLEMSIRCRPGSYRSQIQRYCSGERCNGRSRGSVECEWR